MNLDQITVNTQNSIRVQSKSATVYFDPFEIENETHDADYIFITHTHYDHFQPDSIEKIIKSDTTIIYPAKEAQNIQRQLASKNIIGLSINQELKLDNLIIKAVPAYNKSKVFHPKDNQWLGYVVKIDNTTYYIAGDTDALEENSNIDCDIAFLPIGGKYTMDVNEAAEFAESLQPKIVIPTHFGSIIGDKSLGKEFENKINNIKVVHKLWN